MKSLNYSDVKIKADLTIEIGNKNFDEFLSFEKGLVVGSSIFLTGTSGAGKTTLAITLQRSLSEYRTALYSREMSASRVKTQMKQYPVEHKNAYIADKEMCPTLEAFIKELDEMRPKVVIVDSLQVIMREDYADVSANVSGFNIIQMLRAWTEKNDAVLIVVGHVNKDGEFEGKNIIEHMFDSHMEMIFDKKRNTRTLSWAKNRNGSVEKSLFYEFGEKSIEFYTPEQYETVKNGKKLEDYLLEMIKTFLSSLDTNNPNYELFAEEIGLEMSKIYDSSEDLLDVHLKFVHKIKSLLKKYQF